MRTLRKFFKRLSSWVRTREDEERLRFEIEEHLALQTAENVRAGLSPVEAKSRDSTPAREKSSGSFIRAGIFGRNISGGRGPNCIRSRRWAVSRPSCCS